MGDTGDVGPMEIVEMLFFTKGPIAGAIMIEWNVRADKPRSAAMWDSHISAGEAKGSDLDFATCPKKSLKDK
ncbi:hypothetical protein BR93DRAFT_971377 [Coniochaeta sp. PMI_546]|nr:hypothetical protein BR93DRAFT_971377 [Coniochaeta sp. PMI_546]